MSDQNIADFNTRIERIQQARGKGFGFEAQGTIGRSYYTRNDPKYRRRWRIPVVRPLVLALVFGTMVKALFLHQIGEVAYDQRITGLMAGEGIDRIGGWAMHPDPVTKALASQIGAFARID